MCVIIVAKKGVKVPMENLRAAWNANQDGAGMSFIENGVVRIRKGFMTFDAFLEALRETPIDTDRMFHFRIATAGKIAPEICHPYPVESNFKAMYATDMLTNMACSHNGIISWCNPPQAHTSSFSDSMAFISGYIYPLRHEVMQNTALQEMINRSTNSKFAIMTANGVITIGDFIELGGVFYSNSSWRGGYYKFGDYNYYDDFYSGYTYKDGKFSYNRSSSSVRVGGVEEDDEDILSTSYTSLPASHKEMEYENIESLKEAAQYDGADDPCVIAFYAQDLKEGLNYYDAEKILDFIVEGMDIEVLNCDFDEIQKVLYITVDWDVIKIMPNTVLNTTWSVVC